MPRRTTKTSGNGKGKRDPAVVNVHYGQIISYVFVGAIIGLAIGALALLWVLRVQQDNATSAALIQSQLQHQALY